MKKKGIVTMFCVSLLMAGGAALIAMSGMQEQHQERDALTEAGQVVVAALQIPFGTTVQASDLRVMRLPPE